MAVIFYVCSNDVQTELEKTIDMMEEEDPLSDLETDSAYTTFANILEKSAIQKTQLSETLSEPAENFYEFFHNFVNHDLDKLYLTHHESSKATTRIEALLKNDGETKFFNRFWSNDEVYTLDVAKLYFETVIQYLKLSVEKQSLFVICYI